jgi:hypothetical protein
MRAPATHDERATRYLLGLLPADERESWEERLLVDRHAFESTLAAEDDLIDAYARGELGRRERAAFERSLLERDGTGARLAFAGALATAAARAAAAGRLPAGVAVGRRRWRPAAPLRWAAAAALVAGLGGGVAFLGVRSADLAGRVAELEGDLGAARQERSRVAQERDRLAAGLEGEREARQRERAEAGRQLAALRGQGEELAGELERRRRAAPPPPRATAVSYLLTLATRSAAGIPELVLAPETGRVHLQLDTGAAELYVAYRATLLAPPGGRVAWSRTGIPPAGGDGRPAVELDLPAEIFVSGRYEVLLDGILRSEPEPEPALVGSYEFEVVRR